MKKEYKTPLTEVVCLNVDEILQDGKDQDSTGTITGQDPGILGNEGIFDEADDYESSKSLWDN